MRRPVVAARARVYHSGMSAHAARNVYRLVERNGPAGRRILRSASGTPCDQIVVSGVAGADWPETLVNPRIEPLASAAPVTRWRLASEQGAFEFAALAVDRIEVRPRLFEPLHRRFALSWVERVSVRCLLSLLRFPIGANLLRRWHAGRVA